MTFILFFFFRLYWSSVYTAQHNVSGGSRGFAFGSVCPSFIFYTYPPLSPAVSKERRVSRYFFPHTHTHTDIATCLFS